jgi:tetratricopeptide (TPR) repeat protein
MSKLDAKRWPEISALLDRVLELPDAERATFLASIASDDRALVDEVLTILAGSQQRSFPDFLGTSPAPVGSPDHGGRRLGAYVVESEIGRGGMGSVWRARRADGRFEGSVAIKLLNASLVGKPAEQRFVREGNVLASLHHPHIAPLLDAGVADTGQPYLVLEYVAGERIDRYCELRALTTRQRVALFIDVLSAVSHAHSHLVVHRDLKPANILVTADGVVKLLDFGIAALLLPERADSPSQATVEMSTVFTPDYAAPEQLLHQPLTTATDVYALGLVLFVLLVGKHPHGETTESALGRMRTIVDHDAPQPSALAPDAPTARLLRGDLDAIIAKALRRPPQDRYATVAAFADDLRRYLGDEPVAARAQNTAYRARKFVERHRGSVLGSAAAFLGLIIATGFALVQMREARMQRDRSIAQAKLAEKQAEFVTLMMSTVGESPITASQLLDGGSRLLDAHYASDKTFRAAALINLAARYTDVGEPEKSRAALAQALELGKSLGEDIVVARAECALAGNSLDLGDAAAAATHLAAGKAALAEVPAPDPLYVVDCERNAADVAEARGATQDAIRISAAAQALLERMHQRRDIRYAELLNRESDYYKSLGDSKRGFDFSKRALDAFRDMGLADTDEYLTGMHNVASSLNGFGEMQEGCRLEKDVVTRLDATNRPVVTAIAVTYGSCVLKRDEAAAEALRWYDRGVDAAVTGHDPSLEMHGRTARARALLALKRLDEAGAELDRVDAIAKQNPALGRSTAARARIIRTQLLLARNELTAARVLIEGVVTELRGDTTGKRVLITGALMTAARIALAQQRGDDALVFANEAVAEATRRARDPAKSVDVGESTLLVAQAMTQLGNVADARAAAARAEHALAASLGEQNSLTLAARGLQ